MKEIYQPNTIDSTDESVNECERLNFSSLRSNQHHKRRSLHDFSYIYYRIKYMPFKRHSHSTIYNTLSYMAETEEETANYSLSCRHRQNCRTLRNSCHRF